MRLNELQVFDMDEAPVLSYSYEGYVFNQHRKWHWLQRLCLWTLHKLGCKKTFDFYVNKRVYTDLDRSKKLHEQIWQALVAVDGAAKENPDNIVVYMGKDEFRTLVCDEEVEQYLSFSTSMRLSRYDYHNQLMTDVFGVDCHVVPWLKGFAVLPRPMPPQNVR